MVPKQLRDDLRPVRLRNVATGWSAASAALAASAASAASAATASFCTATAAATTVAVPGHQAEHVVQEEDAQVRPALVPEQLRADLRPVRRRAAVTRRAGVAAAAAAAAATVRGHQEHQLV